jgi:hypothetical protein
MKSIICFTTVLLLVFTSCNLSKGVKKDLNTGLTTSYNGFAVEDVFLTQGEDGVKLSSNKVALGTRVNVMATGVENFAETNGMVFPGCTIILTDKAGKELLNLPDAFSDMSNGLKKEEATTLRATLTTGEPMTAGETYHLKCRFYDKKKSESEIITNVDLVMQ